MPARFSLCVVVMVCAGGLRTAQAFIYNSANDFNHPAGLTGGLRWDAAPRIVGGQDRSLVGGISWNVQGGSFAAYKSQFAWGGAGVPSDVAFDAAVTQAFTFWTAVDPNPQLATSAPFSFVRAPGAITTVGASTGAEIDLLASDLGFAGLAGGALSHPIADDHVTLTSGTSNYASDVIGGVDINMNNHTGSIWTLAGFRAILIHEIGHALGMGHANLGWENRFVDDNYNGTSEATANATLTNPFSHLVNPLDPSNSPGLHLYTVPNTIVGTNASEVKFVMEQFGIGPVPEGTNPLSTDEYAQRQFLYPTQVPEPMCFTSIASITAAMLARRGRRR